MSREIICADALPWLEERVLKGVGSVVTSLPDFDETGQGMEEWLGWFVRAARLCISATSDGKPTLFYQTDRRYKGLTISKSHMILRAAEEEGAVVVWHKVALRHAPGAIDMYRPGFTHIICVARPPFSGGHADTPDVIREGKRLYPNGMVLAAALLMVRFAARFADRVVDPFCGRGTVPAIAEYLGLDALGIDILPEQVEYARALRIRGSEVGATV